MAKNKNFALTILKKSLWILSFVLMILPGQIATKSSPKTKTRTFKDKTCQEINNTLELLNNLLGENKNTHKIQDFLKENRSFFDENNTKIKRFKDLMDNRFVGSEKRQAQKELNFIYAFYICDIIKDPKNDFDIIDFVQLDGNKHQVAYINSVKHVKNLESNYTSLYKHINSIIKLLKKDKVSKNSPINNQLLFSIIYKLESIADAIQELGEFKQEKKKQNLHLTAECTKAALSFFSR